MSKKLLLNQTRSLYVSIVSMATAVIGIFFVAKIVGPSDYGLIGIAISFSGVISVLIQLGLYAGLMRAVSQSDDEKQKNRMFSSALSIRVVLSLVVLMAVILFGDFISNEILSRSTITMILCLSMTAVLLQDIYYLFESYILGMHRASTVFSMTIFMSVLKAMLIIVFTWMYKVEGYFLGLLVANIAGIIIYFWFLKVRMGQGISLPKNRKEFLTATSKIWYIGKVSYSTKLIYGIWQKSPILII